MFVVTTDAVNESRAIGESLAYGRLIYRRRIAKKTSMAKLPANNERLRK